MHLATIITMAPKTNVWPWIIVATILQSLLTTTVNGENNTGFFWQLTDIHFDSNYSQAGELLRNCHVAENGSIHKDKTLGEYGDYFCDSPWTLVTSALSAMKAIEPEPDFILWTGDNVAHVEDDELNNLKELTIIKNVTDLVHKNFPSTEIYPTIGNHDSYPADEIPPKSESFYKNLTSFVGWSKFLDNDAQDTFHKGGYYSTVTKTGMRIIGLNTAFYYTSDHLTSNISDPAEQFAWLSHELYLATEKEEKVILTGHIPPGAAAPNWKSFYPKFNQIFIKLIEKYATSGAIVALIMGHEHTDNFKLLYDIAATVRIPIFDAPSVTPFKFHNPALRLYKYDKLNGNILDYHQYYLELNAANEKGQADWKLEYVATETYGLKDLSANSMEGLVNKFKSCKSQSLFEKYVTYVWSNATQNINCTGICKWQYICAITNVDFNYFDSCVSNHRNVDHTECSVKERNINRFHLIPGVIISVVIVGVLSLVLICTMSYKRHSYARVSKNSVILLDDDSCQFSSEDKTRSV